MQFRYNIDRTNVQKNNVKATITPAPERILSRDKTKKTEQLLGFFCYSS